MTKEKIEQLIEILKEKFPDFMDINEAAQKIGLLPEELIDLMNKHPEQFLDIEIKTNWSGRKLLRFKP